MAAHSASLTVFLCFGREASSYNTTATILLWLNNSSIWGLEDTSSGNETWVFTRSNAYLPPRLLCQEFLQLYGEELSSWALHSPIKSRFCRSHHFHSIQWVAYSIMWTGRLEKGRRKGNRASWFCWWRLFILGGKAVQPPWTLCLKGIPATFSSEPCCPLPALCGSESLPRTRLQLPSSCVCDITELCSPEALNGVFVTACGMFKMLRGPHY